MSLSILLVDDDPESLSSTGKILSFAGHKVIEVISAEAALQEIARKVPDLIVTDVRMPGMSGMDLVAEFQKSGLQIPFIVMTAFGDVKDCVWAMKMGAVDFLLKPFKRKALLDAVEQMEVIRRVDHSQQDSEQSGLVGSSKAMRDLRALVDQVAKTEASVLIAGESGTGKELVSKLIHEKSNFSSGPFIAVNCAAIPETLMESELFGYERGAFSGATQSKIGLIEAAHGGTLLLDEIGDMPLMLQPKLLRVLEEQQIRRLGSNVERKIQVRVIAATHQNLLDLVRSQRFRQDLYYRLDVMPIRVPPLRERREDIPELTQFFLSRFSRLHKKEVKGIDSQAQSLLMEHDWPGNIRELSNALERAVVLNETGLIQAKDLPIHLSRDSVPVASDELVTIPLGTSLKDIEDLMMRRALVAAKGDRAEAARLLGVTERTIYRWISKSKED